ncbi:MAG: TlyA family rRNA (cytidine-2'-O)-methyltransferase [Desulforhopalus sp.]|nr:TlyA family rRNA (cytidine-2'-O)-methyltransferase [Desulforhopalus sp.]
MKDRLDQILIRRKIAPTIETARAMIIAGEIYINEQVSDKPGRSYSTDVSIRIKEKCRYVSRGGLKLEKGLSHFGVSPSGLISLDIGASTGGFTDCLLQHNARKVHAVDVAYGQLAWKIRQDPRVVVLERFNARNITAKDINSDHIDLAVMDVSFISLTTLIPPISKLFAQEVTILALIKPQFELPRDDVGPGGVVSEPALHIKAIEKIESFVQQFGLISKGTVPSPILGPKGNREFIIYISSNQSG